MSGRSNSIPAMECGVCHEEFDGKQRCPRILECFHTLCTNCIKQLIKDNRRNCPFCYQAVQAQSAEDVRINESVLELTKYVVFLRTNVPLPLQDTDVVDSSETDDSLIRHRETTIQHLSVCQAAKDQLESCVLDHEEFRETILKKSENFKAKVLEVVDEITEKNQRMATELNSATCEMEKKLCEVHARQCQIKTQKEELDVIRHVSDSVAPMLYHVEQTNMAMQEWIKNFKVFISNKEILQKAKIKVEERTAAKLDIILELLESCREVKIQSMPALMIQAASPLVMTVEKLQQMSNPIKCLVHRGKVFVTHQQEKTRRSSKLYFTQDNKLCFSCLKDEPTPYNVHVLEYMDIMKMADPTSRLVYLELGANGSTLGRIYIRFDADSPFTDQFSTLCSGAKGPSYLNTKLLEVYRKADIWAWVRGGDYEQNDGSGGQQLVTGLGTGGDPKRPCLAGTLEEWWGCGRAVASQFIIYIKDSSKMVSHSCSAVIEEGLCVLMESICRYPNITDVSITDCGVVLLSPLEKSQEKDT